MDYSDLEKNPSAFNYFWYKARRKLIGVLFSKYNIKGMTILEIGCGAGSQLSALSGCGNKVVGSDINNEALTEARKRGFDVFYQNIEEEVQSGRQYDVVCAFDVLEHVKHDEMALKNIYKLLKPDGYFIFTVPAFRFLFSNHDIYAKHCRRYSVKELKKKLSDNDFNALSLSYWNSVLFPVIALKRLFSKNIRPKSDVSNLPGFLNSFLYGVLFCENQLIKIGARLPFGLSIMGVAKKSSDNKLERESLFHDEWAHSESINDTDVLALFEGVTALENKFITSHMGPLAGKKILDVGCGLGESSVYFALMGAKVVATDVSPQMVRFTEELAEHYGVKIEGVISPAEFLNFNDESFDFIYCANLIHHLSGKPRNDFIKKMHAFLKKGGWFYSWDPLGYNPAINIYRRLAQKVRSSDESPFNFSILDSFKGIFSKTYHKEFWLTTLVLFLKYYFINRYNPNKVRYWKIIYKEKKENIGWWFNGFSKFDGVLLKIPLLRRMAWNILIYAQK